MVVYNNQNTQLKDIVPYSIFVLMNKWLPYLKNKYIIASSVLVFTLLLFEDTTIFRQYKMLAKLDEVKKENDEKRKEITQIKLKINELTTNQSALEKFARETYRMKKKNEVVFLFADKSKVKE